MAIRDVFPVSKKVDHAPIIDAFFGELVAGQLEGVRPQAALASDVHLGYKAWAQKRHLPATPANATFNRYITGRHGIKTMRKRYASGGFILGPHSILFLAGPVYAAYGTEPQELGRQVAAFREQIERFIRSTGVLEQAAPVPAHVR